MTTDPNDRKPRESESVEADARSALDALMEEAKKLLHEELSAPATAAALAIAAAPRAARGRALVSTAGGARSHKKMDDKPASGKCDGEADGDDLGEAGHENLRFFSSAPQPQRFSFAHRPRAQDPPMVPRNLALAAKSSMAFRSLKRRNERRRAPKRARPETRNASIKTLPILYILAAPSPAVRKSASGRGGLAGYRLARPRASGCNRSAGRASAWRCSRPGYGRMDRSLRHRRSTAPRRSRCPVARRNPFSPARRDGAAASARRPAERRISQTRAEQPAQIGLSTARFGRAPIDRAHPGAPADCLTPASSGRASLHGRFRLVRHLFAGGEIGDRRRRRTISFGIGDVAALVQPESPRCPASRANGIEAGHIRKAKARRRFP